MDKYVAAEMCQTMNRHWGLGGRDFAYLGPGQIIENLCACRKVGANYLLNVGPTAAGEIPPYEAAALERVGDWVRLHGELIYEGKPSSLKGPGADFALEGNDKIYLFIHQLAVSGHGHVTMGVGGAGPRAFSGLRRKIASVRWLDNQEELAFAQDPESGLFSFAATGYPYGVDLVVRVAELKPA
jgi:alpha-L-fucosidase